MSTDHWTDTPTHLILPSLGPSPASWGRGRRKNTSILNTLQPFFSKCTLPRQLTLHTWCQKISRYASTECKWVLLKQKTRKHQHSKTAWFLFLSLHPIPYLLTAGLLLLFLSFTSQLKPLMHCMSVWCNQLTLYEESLHFNIVFRHPGVSRCSNSFNLL